MAKQEKTNQITFTEARRLSLIKWRLLAQGFPTEFVRESPELANIHNGCGFCERYSFNKKGACTNCEFGKMFGKCIENSESLYLNWLFAKTQVQKIAIAKQIVRGLYLLRKNK